MDFTPLLSPYEKLFKASPLKKKNSIPLVVMILSPHPDDECISGALAFRLKAENNASVINIAVTLGSNPERKDARKSELLKACKTLGTECAFLSDKWTSKAKELKSLIQKYAPDIIIAPHLKDHHPTHIQTAELLRKVLMTFKKESFIVASSEFWGQMSKPNLLLEVPSEILELQMKALMCHEGEVARNPYHLRLPAWMIDNVRRGSEIIGGKGTSAPVMAFGVLYKIEIYANQKFTKPKNFPGFITNLENLGQILEAASGSKTNVKRG